MAEKKAKDKKPLKTDQKAVRPIDSVAAMACLQTGYPERLVKRAIQVYISIHGNANFSGAHLSQLITQLDEVEQEQEQEEEKKKEISRMDEKKEKDKQALKTDQKAVRPIDSVAAMACLQTGYPERLVKRAIQVYISIHGNANFSGAHLSQLITQLDEVEQEQEEEEKKVM